MDRPVRELNLELGRPDAAEALRRLAAEVEAARKMGTPAMKLIHGYGSSGKGGRLRTACRTWLRQQELCFLPAGGWPCVPGCGRTGIWTPKTGASPLSCWKNNKNRREDSTP